MEQIARTSVACWMRSGAPPEPAIGAVVDTAGDIQLTKNR